MKKPVTKDLKLNDAKTKRIRSAMSRQKNIKITINIDADTLAKLRAIADETGVPYQRLINRTLADSLAEKRTLESRLKQVEKQLKALKKEVAA